MSCCRCCPNLIPMIEIEIKGDILVPEEKPNIKLPLPETNIQKLKDNIICDYYEAISQLEQGKISNIEFLLEKISAVDLVDEIDKREFIIQYYLNK